jgi:cytochrome c biogenesis protein CcmG, thiol:disulfide interchange protein DsbE
LVTYGNPFTAIGSDIDGRTTIDFGSYGVPETFVVDGNGIIRYKVIGGLGPSMADGSFFKEVQKAALLLK